MEKEYFLTKSKYTGRAPIDEIKGYAHFDLRSSLNQNWDFVTDADKVAKHAFFPLIHFKKVHKKFDKDAPKKYKLKPRDIYYSAHLDRCIYMYYGAELNERYNQRIINDGINDAVIAYRTNLEGKCNIDFAHDAFNAIRQTGDSYVLIGDFKSFFDRLNHEYLKKQIASLLGVEKLPKDYFAVYKSITQFSYVELGTLILNACEKNEKCYKKGPTSETCEGFICELSGSVCTKNKYFLANGKSRINIEKYACGSFTDATETEWEAGKCLNRKCHYLFNQQRKTELDPIRKSKQIKSHIDTHIKSGEEKIGIPQGSAISAILANIYMLDFDKRINNFVQLYNGKYMRYSDDFIIILPYSDKFEAQYKEIKRIQESIPDLILEDKKTRIYRCSAQGEEKVKCCTPEFAHGGKLEKDVIEYLGFAFDGESVKIRDKTISKYYYRAYRKIKTINNARKFVENKKLVGVTQLYLKYSKAGADGYTDPETRKYKSGNFITYAKRAESVFSDSKKVGEITKSHMWKIKKRLKDSEVE